MENLFSAKDFFEEDNVPRKLTKESQIGLYGEIYVLRKILTKKLANEIAICAWTGPSKKHDFTTENKLIEVKTTVTNAKKINTSSTNQIAPVFDKRLDLVFLQMKKSNTGLSLNEAIDEYINKLKGESELLHNNFLLSCILYKKLLFSLSPFDSLENLSINFLIYIFLVGITF